MAEDETTPGTNDEVRLAETVPHLRRCPRERDESFVAERPGAEGRPAANVGIVRCIDCGQSVTVDANEVLEERERFRKQASRGRKAGAGSKEQ